MVSRAALAKGLTILSETFGRKLSPVTSIAYGVTLEEIEDEAFERATLKALETCKHFPWPSELIGLCGGGAAADETEAWQLIMTAVRRYGRFYGLDFGDPRIHAAIRAIGGWSKICDQKTDTLHFLEKQFGEAYQHAVTHEPSLDAGRPLVGNVVAGKPIRIEGQIEEPNEERKLLGSGE